jgi:hypothetical protein
MRDVSMSLDYLLRPSAACADLNDIRERLESMAPPGGVGRRTCGTTVRTRTRGCSPEPCQRVSPVHPPAVMVDYMRVFFMLQA